MPRPSTPRKGRPSRESPSLPPAGKEPRQDQLPTGRMTQLERAGDLEARTCTSITDKGHGNENKQFGSRSVSWPPQRGLVRANHGRSERARGTTGRSREPTGFSRDYSRWSLGPDRAWRSSHDLHMGRAGLRVCSAGSVSSVDANIDDGDPEIGHFSPWSWWPILSAGSIAIMFVGSPSRCSW